MAKIEVNGINDFINMTEVAKKMTGKQIESSLMRGAECVRREIISAGGAMGVHKTGTMLQSFNIKPVKKTGDGYICEIVSTGKNPGGARNAEVAFLNEYGVPSKNMPPRPFMLRAKEKSEPQVVKIFEEELASKLT